MKIFVESWKSAENDHCWLDQSNAEDYIEDSICYGCGSPMEVIAEVLNSHGDVGLVTGLCPCCGYVKRTRNLPYQCYSKHFSENCLKRRPNEHVVENRYLFDKLVPFFSNKGRVLDVGCGLGTRLIPFKNAGYDVYGVEPSENRSSKASKNLGNIQTATAETYLEDCPYSFDLIYFFDVLQFIQNPFKLLSMAAEKLNDQGLIYIHVGTFYLDNNFCQFSHLGVLQSFLSLYSMRKLIYDLNMEIVLYSERPFELVVRKGIGEQKAQKKTERAQKLTKSEVWKFAQKTLKMYQLMILSKAKLKLNFKGREVAIRTEGPLDKSLPILFVHNTSNLPILLK